MVERESDGTTLHRHSDHLKQFEFDMSIPAEYQPTAEVMLKQWHEMFERARSDNDDENNEPIQFDNLRAEGRRARRNNTRYFNDDFVNE